MITLFFLFGAVLFIYLLSIDYPMLAFFMGAILFYIVVAFFSIISRTFHRK